MAQFELTRSDFFSASWYLQRNYRRRLYVGALLAILGACMVIGERWLSLWLAATFATLAVATWIGLRLLKSKGRILRIYDDHLASFSEFTLILSEEGFDIRNRNSSAEIAWRDLKFWSENERFFFLFQGKDFAQIIPISSLSEEELAIIRRKTAGLKDI